MIIVWILVGLVCGIAITHTEYELHTRRLARRFVDGHPVRVDTSKGRVWLCAPGIDKAAAVQGADRPAMLIEARKMIRKVRAM